jgi:hypothetical protein
MTTTWRITGRLSHAGGSPAAGRVARGEALRSGEVDRVVAQVLVRGRRHAGLALVVDWLVAPAERTRSARGAWVVFVPVERGACRSCSGVVVGVASVHAAPVPGATSGKRGAAKSLDESVIFVDARTIAGRDASGAATDPTRVARDEGTPP